MGEGGQGEGAENDKDEVTELRNNGVKIAGANAGGKTFEAVSPTDSMASIDSASSASASGQNNEGSVPKDIKHAPGMGGRRLSNVSDEERDKARMYREGVRAQGGTSLHPFLCSPPEKGRGGERPRVL